MRSFVLFGVLSLFATMDLLAQSASGDRIAGAPFASRSQVIAPHAMAATSHPLATQIAVDILKKGGSAVDAAIAANAALGVMEPTGCGPGGDLFAIVWDPQSRMLHGLNASGRSPRGLSYADVASKVSGMGRETLPPRGAITVSVPGAVDGWFTLHERFGTLPVAELLAPAIAYARDGFPVTQSIAVDWKDNIDAILGSSDMVEELDNFRETYLLDGRPPAEGDVFRNPDLARTYELIARGGRDAFYEGEIADILDAYMRRIGGYLRKADLEAHSSTWVDPVSVNYRGYDVYELPPNGQGIAALQMLTILEGFDLASMGHNSAEYLHVQAEAKKLAFADRARFYADPDFYDVPVDRLISEEYAEQRRSLIHRQKAMEEVDHGDARLLEGDTIYLTTADSTGMMVSLIQSNFLGLGSGLVADGLGFGLQNRGQLFAMERGHPNIYEPGKRPFQTIIPAFIMKDGEPYMSFGVMGGPMQPQGHVQIVTNMIDFGMNLQEAGDAARYRHEGSSEPTGEVMRDGGVLHVESGVAPAVVEELRRRGHEVVVSANHYGGYQAIRWDAANGIYFGASEMRKDGQAAGY